MANKRADALIFDVDGVLIDTRDSYLHVTADTIRWGWENLYDGVCDAPGYTIDYFNSAKAHPAFNDDTFVALAMLHMMARNGSRLMSEAFPSLREWERELTTYERHVEAEAAIAARPDEDRRIGLEELRLVSDELYFGEATYREIKGKAVHGISGAGYWNTEQPALKKDWKDLGLPVGVYTGRSPDEFTLAKHKLNWHDFPDRMLVSSGQGILKPSPLGLELLCERAGAESPLFFGDTASDRAAWRNFGRGTFVAIGPILKGEKDHYDTVEQALADLLP